MDAKLSTRKTLSVRAKILLTVVVSVIGLSILIYAISETLILKSYLQIEQSGMERDLSRAVDAIGEFSNQQMIKLTDWASWDEAYTYTKDRDPAWPPTSIYPSSMANLDNNLAMFTNPDGSIFYAMVANIKERTEVSSQSVETYFSSHPELVAHQTLESATQGLVMLPEGPMIIVSLPVKTSEGEGPLHGSLTFGRFLDEDKITELGKITHLSLAVYRYDAQDLSPSLLQAREALTGGQTYYVYPESANLITGYALLKDVHGNPALILRIDAPRPIYVQGNLALFTYFIISALALLLFGIIIILLLDRFVISRFVRLSDEVEKVNDVHDLTIRMQSTVKDEVGVLADKINQLLEWLSEAREAESASRREIVNLLDELKKGKEQAEEMAAVLSKKTTER